LKESTLFSKKLTWLVHTWHAWSIVLCVFATVTYCNTQQHSTTHCSILQHTAVHCIDQASNCSTLHRPPPQHTATHCNTLQHTATYCNTLHRGPGILCVVGPLQLFEWVVTIMPDVATHCNTLQHTATHTATICCTFQHTAGVGMGSDQYVSRCDTAPHLNTLQVLERVKFIVSHTATHYNTLQRTATHCGTH